MPWILVGSPRGARRRRHPARVGVTGPFPASVQRARTQPCSHGVTEGREGPQCPLQKANGFPPLALTVGPALQPRWWPPCSPCTSEDLLPNQPSSPQGPCRGSPCEQGSPWPAGRREEAEMVLRHPTWTSSPATTTAPSRGQPGSGGRCRQPRSRAETSPLQRPAR